SEVQPKRDGISRDAVGWAVKTDRHHSFDKERLEVAALDRPTVVHQRRETPLRRIDVERGAYSCAEAVPDGPHKPRMHGEVYLTRSIWHSGNHFQVEGHPPFSFESDSKRKADGKVIRYVSRCASAMCYQWQHKPNVTT